MSVKTRNKTGKTLQVGKKPLEEAVKEFRRYLEDYPSRRGKKRTDGTIEEYMRIVDRLAEYLAEQNRESFKDVTSKELEAFVLSYKSRKSVWGKNRRREVKSETIKWQYRNMIIAVLRLFYQWLYDLDEKYPDCVKTLKKLTVRQPITERSRVKKPKDLLSDEEIEKLLVACEHGKTQIIVKRDRALTSVLYESGGRAGEIINVNNEDLERTDYGFRVWVEGKTGRRAIPLIDSLKYLLDWANVHPRADDPESPLFVSLSHKTYGKRLGRGSLYGIVKRLANRAGIKKCVYPHLFRHTRSTKLVDWMSEAYLRKIQGWTKTSQMPALYVHLSGKEVEKVVLRARGITPEEKFRHVLEARKCPECGYENRAETRLCTSCGSLLRKSEEVLPLLAESYQKTRKIEEMERRLNQLEFRMTHRHHGALTLSDTPIDRGQADFILSALEASPETQQFIIKNLKKQLGR